MSINPGNMIPKSGIPTRVRVKITRGLSDNKLIYKIWDGRLGLVVNTDFELSPVEATFPRPWTYEEFKIFTRGQKWEQVEVFVIRERDGSLSMWEPMEAIEKFEAGELVKR